MSSFEELHRPWLWECRCTFLYIKCLLFLFNFLWTSSWEGWSFHKHEALMVWSTWSWLTTNQSELTCGSKVIVQNGKQRLFLKREKKKSMHFIFTLKYPKYLVLETIKLQLENKTFKILDYRIFLELVQITLVSTVLLNPNS